MKINTKKLTTLALIFLVLPFVTTMIIQNQYVAAAGPTVEITEAIPTSTNQIEVTVEITLVGYTYDFYTKYLRLYLNQSIDTIIDNGYSTYNATKELARPTQATFETTILSPILSDGSNLDSANYNVTVVAITSTTEYSTPEEWIGGYIFIDTGLPEITFISPSVVLEEIWGDYQVIVNVTDASNLSQVIFYIDNNQRHVIDDPTPGQITYVWDWYSVYDTRAEHTIRVKAIDNSAAQNDDDLAFTVKVVGPSIKYNVAIPSYVDSNDTLDLNITASDLEYDIDSVMLNYTIDDGPWQFVAMDNYTENDDYNYTLGSYPVGTKISWEIFVNNTAGQYHVFGNLTYQPHVVYSVYPDHINPVGSVEYDKAVIYNQDIIVKLNVTEQSPITYCIINYTIGDNIWISNAFNNTENGTTWFYYEYKFNESYPIFTQIKFYVWLNDSGNNILKLNNAGKNYVIKIIPEDLIAPNITILSIPEKITSRMNITVTVNINETSALSSVLLYYSINGRQFFIEMIEVAPTEWSASFVIEANTGDVVRIWVRAMDEYFNTGESIITTFTVESDKGGVTHSNFFLWLIFILLTILPFIITIVILKPQK